MDEDAKGMGNPQARWPNSRRRGDTGQDRQERVERARRPAFDRKTDENATAPGPVGRSYTRDRFTFRVEKAKLGGFP